MKYTMAIIGFGGMGTWHKNNICERVPDLNVKGIFDIRGEAKEKAEAEGLYVYSSLEELLADDEVKLITVATPNDKHKPYAIACLEAGKNVISEKPVTINVADLEDIMAVAKKTGKIFSIHHNRRWDKDYRIIKKIIDEDMIGTPYFIESRVQGSRQAMHGWRGHKVNGGGMLLDWGVHLLDQMMDMIKSPVVSVSSHLLSLYSDQVDDNIKVFIKFENGVSSILEMSTNCLINNPRWHVSCLNGTAVIDDFSAKGKIVQLRPDADELQWEDEIVYTEAGPTRTMAPRPSFTTHELALPEVETDWSDFYKNIVAVMDGTEELIVKPEQALRVMKVIELAFKASEENKGFNCHI